MGFEQLTQQICVHVMLVRPPWVRGVHCTATRKTYGGGAAPEPANTCYCPKCACVEYSRFLTWLPSVTCRNGSHARMARPRTEARAAPLPGARRPLIAMIVSAGHLWHLRNIHSLNCSCYLLLVDERERRWHLFLY